MKTYIIALFATLYSVVNIQAQMLEFELFPAGETNGSCTSASDPDNNIQCYSVVYTPGVSGTLTSYTLGFLGTCVDGNDPFILDESSSCIMNDFTNTFDGCAVLGQILIQLSGNTGNVDITAGEPIVIHQACFELAPGDMVVLSEETTTGLTFSIDSTGTGNPINDIPVYNETTIEVIAGCEAVPECNLDFGLAANRITFANMPTNKIVDATSLDNSFSTSQLIDVYDESNLDCTTAGGLSDFRFEFQLLNTFDINGNGFIDTLAGLEHNIEQGQDGIVGSIPFNTTPESNSSAGDIRGYSMELHFEDHIGIVADQLVVHLEGMNSAGEAFESASLVFFDQNRQPYGNVSHLGNYTGENDLSGNCTFVSSQTAYDSTGVGVVIFQDTLVKDNTLPCQPGIGMNGSLDTLSVNARIHGGLDSAAVVSGFRLIVLGEDIASPDMLDDGSGIFPDDGIAANDTTATNSTLVSSIRGLSIDGCVFQPLIILPVKWRDFAVQNINNNAIINWSTETEINNDYFDVEWSLDGRNFEDIKQVDASENVQGVNQYRAVHDNPANGINYYRIKQVDLDGQFSYSDIQSISISDVKKISFSPNPVEGLLQISSFDASENLLTRIFNSTGQLVFENYSHTRELDLSLLQSGIYQIRFMQGAHSEAHNLIKI